jgi:ABC-type Na+ efflux pump permease subunit
VGYVRPAYLEAQVLQRFTGGKMKYYREITGSAIVLILLSAIISMFIVCGMAADNTSDSEKPYYALAGFMLNPSDSDKELIMQRIDASDELSGNEKTELKQDMIDVWDRYPDNTEEDLITVKKTLDITMAVAENEKTAETTTSDTTEYNTITEVEENIPTKANIENSSEKVESTVENIETTPENMENTDEEEEAQSTAASPGFSALGLVFVISLILLQRKR